MIRLTYNKSVKGRIILGGTNKETNKHTDFSIADIVKYLEESQKLIAEDRYSIAQNENRQENIEFIEDYRIFSKKEKEILLSLTHLDFCYAVDNEKEKFEDEVLYVFCKECELDHWGELVDVKIYIKTNVTKTRKGKYMFVISFHKLNKPITFLFR